MKPIDYVTMFFASIGFIVFIGGIGMLIWSHREYKKVKKLHEAETSNEWMDDVRRFEKIHFDEKYN